MVVGTTIIPQAEVGIIRHRLGQIKTKNSLNVLLADSIRMKFLHRIPYAVHPPIVALASSITDDVVGSHFADYAAGRWQVLDLLHF